MLQTVKTYRSVISEYYRFTASSASCGYIELLCSKTYAPFPLEQILVELLIVDALRKNDFDFNMLKNNRYTHRLQQNDYFLLPHRTYNSRWYKYRGEVRIFDI